MAANSPISPVVGNPVESSIDCVSSMDNSILKDDTYDTLKQCLLVSGRGRPPKPPEVKSSNKLLLQLYALRNEAGATFTEVHTWIKRIFPEMSVEENRLKNDMQRTWAKGEKLLKEGGLKSLCEFAALSYNPDYLSDELQELGIGRSILLDTPAGDFSINTPIPNLSNRVIVQLENFRTANKRYTAFVVAWTAKLTGADPGCISKQLPQCLKMYAAVRKRRDRQPEEFERFMTAPFLISPDAISSCGPSLQVPPPILPTCNPPPSTLVTDEDLVTATSAPKAKQYKSKFVQTEQDTLNEKLNLQNREYKKELKETRERLEATLSSKLYKKNWAFKKENLEKDKLIDALNTEIFQNNQHIKKKDEEIAELKKEKLALQKNVSRLKKEKEKLVAKLEEERSSSQAMISFFDESVETRTGSCNKFSDNVRTAIMSLQGDAGVAASKCPLIIDIVSRHIFGQSLDLPHWTTASKIVEEANVVAKMHVAEEVMKNEHVTLHTDATSRDKRKYVGQQLTLDDGTVLSLGFAEVATEDANTLLETTIAVLDELSDVMNEQADRDALFKNIVSTICSTMSDRASVMKSFNEKFAAFRNSCLGKEVRTNFLFCNAHFLLGMSTSCEEGLKMIEKELVQETGEKLGRDKHSLFFTYQGGDEIATARLIRTAADCLGPRGDEKNGCREEWLSFCRKEGVKSLLTSYRSNRFNNFFQNAEAVFFHKDTIEVFLSRYATSSNRKLQSVLFDIQDNSILVLLCAVSLLFVQLTLPYWKLVNSNVSYTDLPRYIKQMKGKIERWREQPEELYLTECRGVFDGEFYERDEDRFSDLLDFAKGNEVTMTKTLKVVLGKLSDVTDRQLSDFLQDGAFGGEISEEVQAELKNCPLSNLTGEHAFGDLDYDLSHRRNCSLLNRGTKHMLKRNKTMAWLAGKSEHDKRAILEEGRKRGKEMRRKFKIQEGIVRLKIKDKIIENERKRYEKEVAEANKKQAIIDRVLKDGGVCKSKTDVEKLERNGNSSIETLKAQLQYHKVVLGNKKILVGGNKETLRHRLITYLEEGRAVKGDCPSPPRKKRKVQSAGSAEENSDSGEEEDCDESIESNESDEVETGTPDDIFKFERQGMWVAVYYDDQVYIGQVTEVLNPESGIVKFLTATKCRPDYFKWPRTEDIAEVSCQYIIKWDFDVVPASNDGRIWQVPSIQHITKSYDRIKNA